MRRFDWFIVNLSREPLRLPWGSLLEEGQGIPLGLARSREEEDEPIFVEPIPLPPPIRTLREFAERSRPAWKDWDTYMVERRGVVYVFVRIGRLQDEEQWSSILSSFAGFSEPIYLIAVDE